jgi:hypothetical protein
MSYPINPIIYTCIALVLLAIPLNRVLGGSWRDNPWRFKPAAFYLYFFAAGLAVMQFVSALVW